MSRLHQQALSAADRERIEAAAAATAKEAARIRLKLAQDEAARIAAVEACEASAAEDRANEAAELLKFIAEFGTANTMPTEAQLMEHGRSDLCDAIARNGGSVLVSDQLGLHRPAPKLPPPGAGGKDSLPTRKTLKRVASRNPCSTAGCTNSEGLEMDETGTTYCATCWCTHRLTHTPSL